MSITNTANDIAANMLVAISAEERITEINKFVKKVVYALKKQ